MKKGEQPALIREWAANNDYLTPGTYQRIIDASSTEGINNRITQRQEWQDDGRLYRFLLLSDVGGTGGVIADIAGAAQIADAVNEGGGKEVEDVQVSENIIKGFKQHAVDQSITRGFKTSDILKIIKEGKPVQAIGRYGPQTRFTLGGNTVVVNAKGEVITVFSNAGGTINGLGKGLFIPFK